MNQIFSENLKTARNEKKLTYVALSSKVGISGTSLSAYERGTKSPTIDNASRLAEALGVSLDWLCGFDEMKKKNATDFLKILVLADSRLTGGIQMDTFVLDKGATRTGGAIKCSKLTIYNEEVSNFIDAYKFLLEPYKNGQIDKNVFEPLLESVIEKFGKKIAWEVE